MKIWPNSRLINSWVWVLIFLHSITALSYNRPKFCPNGTWYPNATTFANETTCSHYTKGMFVDINNTIYAASWTNDSVTVWRNGSSTPTRNLKGSLYEPNGLFVTSNGDIYVDNGKLNQRVDKWSVNATNSVMVMNVSAPCNGLFIDTNNTLYCSLTSVHKVVKSSLGAIISTPTTVAGTGLNGSTSNMFNGPFGIFVDENFTLYVADQNNNRIQLFWFGKLNGTTVAGSTAPISFALNGPTGVVLDADGYLFITDTRNYRIVGSSSNGFRCIAGCSGISGSTADKLLNSRYLSFDIYGNIFVTDDDNSRIQKFMIQSNSCDPSTTTEQTWITSINPTTVKTEITSELATLIKSTDFPSIGISSTETTTVTTTTIQQPEPFFIPEQCMDTAYIGSACNVSSSVCDMAHPCENNGTCYNDALINYSCLCSSGFIGDHCELDHRPCQPYTCLSHGLCNQTSDTTFECICDDGWQGIHCESLINLCDNNPCGNNGVCQPLVLNYTCQCLVDQFYSGFHCETSSVKIIIYEIISKSFAAIAAAAMIGAAMFVVIMDILKYCLEIDPVREERERIRRANKHAKRRKRPISDQLIYVRVSSFGNVTPIKRKTNYTTKKI